MTKIVSKSRGNSPRDFFIFTVDPSPGAPLIVTYMKGALEEL